MPDPTTFSFDVYPGLDADLEAAFERNVQAGIAKPGEVATGGLAQAVQNALPTQPGALGGNLVRSPDVQTWARAELDGDGGGLSAWKAIESQLGMRVPDSLDELLEGNPNLAPTLERLHEAKQALIASGEVTPEGLNVGETMKLTLVPWRAFEANLQRLPEWIKEMRDVQGKATNDDYFNNNLKDAIMNGDVLYRAPADPDIRISAEDYLDGRLQIDGPWGVLLTQNSEQAGIESLKVVNVDGTTRRQSPDEMTDNGSGNLIITGQKVDALGVFEWLSMTLQNDPTQLSGSTDISWLLANRLDVSGLPYVPAGCFNDGQVSSNLNFADRQREGARVRLAVI